MKYCQHTGQGTCSGLSPSYPNVSHSVLKIAFRLPAHSVCKHWTVFGESSNSPWTVFTILTQFSDSLCIIFRQSLDRSLDNLLTIFGHSLDSLCTLLGQSMDSRQTVFGKSLESLWRVFRQFLDSLRIFFYSLRNTFGQFFFKNNLWTLL